jgi:hypothetical protein
VYGCGVGCEIVGNGVSDVIAEYVLFRAMFVARREVSEVGGVDVWDALS